VVTSIDGTSVKIAWSAPYANSSPITAYQIQVLQADGLTWLADIVDCDGSNAGIISATYCEVPMSTLRTTFGLSYGSLVEARVLAINAYGSGSYSEANTEGATILTEPSQMSSPTLGALSSISTLQVLWSSLSGANTGGSPVDSYHL
jgi:hypothetical protein